MQVDLTLLGQEYFFSGSKTKLAIVKNSETGNTIIKILSQKEINQEKKKGTFITSNVVTIGKEIVNSTPTIKIEQLNRDEAQKFHFNIRRLVLQIENENYLLKHIPFASSIDKIFKKYGFKGLFNEKNKALKILQDKLYDRKCIVLKPWEKSEILRKQLINNSETFAELEANSLKQLIVFNDNETFTKLQNDSVFRNKLINELKNEEVNTPLFYFAKALKSLSSYDESTQKQKGFLEELWFIEKYRHLINSGDIGQKTNNSEFILIRHTKSLYLEDKIYYNINDKAIKILRNSSIKVD